MTPEEHRDEALRRIAALTVDARRQTDRMGRLPAGAAEAYLCDVEAALSALIVWNAVPARPPDTPAAAVHDGTVITGTVITP